MPKYFWTYLYRQRSKDRENATYFTTLGDEMAAKKALARSVEINYELVGKFVKVCHICLTLQCI